MKTLLIVIVLALTISLSGNATTLASGVKSQTENMAVSKTHSSSAMKSGKSKKARMRHHKHTTSGAKKAK